MQINSSLLNPLSFKSNIDVPAKHLFDALPIRLFTTNLFSFSLQDLFNLHQTIPGSQKIKKLIFNRTEAFGVV